jgi:hypothetical protein
MTNRQITSELAKLRNKISEILPHETDVEYETYWTIINALDSLKARVKGMGRAIRFTNNEQEMAETILRDIIKTDQGQGWETKHWKILLSTYKKIKGAK